MTPIQAKFTQSVPWALPVELRSGVSTTKVTNAPLEAADDEGALVPANSHQTHSSQCILVVEDDTDTRQLFSEVLVGSGYQVDTARDGEAGWKILQAVRYDPDSYDLLITDNNMPKLSGVELVMKLRYARMTLPVILASGTAPINTEWLHLAGPLQLASVLPKPFSPNQLVQTVKEVLHRSTVITNRKSSCPNTMIAPVSERVSLPGRGCSRKQSTPRQD